MELDKTVGFIGLGAMGMGMAQTLVSRGFVVKGFDISAAARLTLQESGGLIVSSPREAATHSSILVIVVANSAQANSVLFDPTLGAVAALPKSASIVICSTVPPVYFETMSAKILEMGRTDLYCLDAPISGGAVKAAAGQLTILHSGSLEQRDSVRKVIDAMAERVYSIPGSLGIASKTKVINQLLAGVHIAAASEAMSLAVALKLNTKRLFDHINASDAWSWMFENRVLHMLENNWTPRSALDIFVKDMGIVMSMANSVNLPLPLSAISEQVYLAASTGGFGRDDDSSLVRFYLPKAQASSIHDLQTALPIQGEDEGMDMICDLLRAIHLVAVHESSALANAYGLDHTLTFEIISNAAGTSRVYEKFGRVPSSLNEERGSYAPTMALKLGMAVAEARSLKVPTYLASCALQALLYYHQCKVPNIS